MSHSLQVRTGSRQPVDGRGSDTGVPNLATRDKTPLVLRKLTKSEIRR